MERLTFSFIKPLVLLATVLLATASSSIAQESAAPGATAPALEIGRRVVTIVDADEDARALDIIERVAVRNPSDMPFVSSTSGAMGPMGLLRFSVPRGAYDLTLDENLRNAEFIPIDRGFGSLVTVPPGSIDVTFAYRVPYTAQQYELILSAVYPTESLWLLLPERLAVTSAELRPRETIAIGRQRYQVLVADDLSGGARVTATVAGLPFTPRPWLLEESALRGLAASLAALGLAGAGLYAWRRGGRRVLSAEC